MRILHTAHSYLPEVSGVAGVVRQISTRLARRGHEVHVATYGPHARQHEVDQVEGVWVHRFAVEGNWANRMKGDVNRYVGFVRSTKWDVVAMHCAQTWTTDALLPHLDEIDAAKIFVGHGLSALNNPNYRSYFNWLAEALRHVDRVVALSELLEEVSFCAKHGLPQPRIIPNGVDVGEWRMPVRGLRKAWKIGQRPWLLSVSNHSTVKGHRVFFELVRRVRKQVPGTVGSILGGSYPAAKWGLGYFGIKGGCWYRCRVAAFFLRFVSLRSGLPREYIVSAFKEADLVLITSFREASPLVVLESMAAGTPWVSFNVGCVRQHAGGLVVGSLAEMVSTVSELLQNDERRRKLGQAGQTQVTAGHDWEFIVAKYEQLYGEAIRDRGRRG